MPNDKVVIFLFEHDIPLGSTLSYIHTLNGINIGPLSSEAPYVGYGELNYDSDQPYKYKYSILFSDNNYSLPTDVNSISGVADPSEYDEFAINGVLEYGLNNYNVNYSGYYFGSTIDIKILQYDVVEDQLVFDRSLSRSFELSAMEEEIDWQKYIDFNVCPSCQFPTLTAAITTNYFINALDKISSFSFPIPVTLTKNISSENCYNGSVNTKLIFWDDTNSLTEEFPEDVEYANIVAQLSYNGSLNRWQFVWTTEFQEEIHTSILSLEQENPTCPFGQFTTNLPEDEDIETVCIGNSIIETPQFLEILVWSDKSYVGNHPFNSEYGEYWKDHQVVNLYRSGGYYGEGSLWVRYESYSTALWLDDSDDPTGRNLNSYIFELFINRCSGKKIFKWYRVPISNYDVHDRKEVSGAAGAFTLIPDDYSERPYSDYPTYYNAPYNSPYFPNLYISFIDDIGEGDNTIDFSSPAWRLENAMNRSVKNIVFAGWSSAKYNENIAIETRRWLLPSGFNSDLYTPFNSNEFGPLFIRIKINGGPEYQNEIPDSITKFIAPPSFDVVLNKIKIGQTITSVECPEGSTDQKIDFAKSFMERFHKNVKYGDFSISSDRIEYDPDDVRHVHETWFGDYFLATDTSRQTIKVKLEWFFYILRNISRTENGFLSRRDRAINRDGFYIVTDNEVTIISNWYVNSIEWYVNNALQFLNDDQLSELNSFIGLTTSTLQPNSSKPFSKSTNEQIEFQGEDGDSAIITIQDTDLIIKNDNDQLVFDFGGDQEHTFTEIGESHTFTVDGLTYKITFDGYGSLIFSIIDVIPSIEDFDTFTSESLNGVTVVEYEIPQNVEVGFNAIDDEELTGDIITYYVEGVELEIDQAYDKTVFAILKKDDDTVIYFYFDITDNVDIYQIIDFYKISNFGIKTKLESLLDYTQIPNSLPRSTSSNGVEIVSLTGNYIGISFEPKNNLSEILIDVNVFGNEFRIDAAYNGSEFCLNELRTPTNNSSTMFTFLSTLDYGINTYRSSKIIDGERIRLGVYGYY